jgi:hypothetical protein
MTVWGLTVDCAHPGAPPTVSFLKVPEGKVVKNRLHIDVTAGGGREPPWDVRWPVERLTAAGMAVERVDEIDTWSSCATGVSSS